IHTDGCCLHNDEEGIRAGYGLYYGPKDSRNNGFRLSSSEPQTNHRVELAAVLQALVDNPALPLTICTDSQYAINCVKVWWEKWEANGYRNTKGKRVENDDLVRRIVEETNKRRRKSLATDFILVPARSGVTGNQRAKLLA
ncbi:ribonuclease H-like domain-containing protein, partial [Myxozyma melibiosi]